MKHKNLILSAFIVSIFFAAMSVPLFAGEETDIPHEVTLGEESTDFTGYTAITNIQELSDIRNNLKGKYYLANDIIFPSGSSSNFTPIGSLDSSFSGIFDGNGHVIDGMRMEVNTTSTASSGLFAYVTDGGQIKNLGVVNGSSVVASSVYEASAGSIAGHAQGALITNCYNTGSVSASITAPSSYNRADAGGIVGYVIESSITNCYNTGSVSASSTVSPAYNRADAGGIVGLLSSNSFIVYCYNTGSVTATSTNYVYAGGTVGYTFAGVTNCYNTGSVTATAVTATSANYAYAGGIAGYSPQIENCYNTGSVSASATVVQSAHVGGIVAECNQITNCYYLEGMLSRNGLSCSDTLTESRGWIDGSVYNRSTSSPDQRSSTAKTLTEMTPSLSAAGSNNSIYFTGTAETINGTVVGWNFNTVWAIDDSGMINDGLPTLRSAIPPISVKGRVTFEGAGLQGVSIEYNLGGIIQTPLTTDQNGNYSIVSYLSVKITAVKLTNYNVSGQMPPQFNTNSTANFTMTAVLFTVKGQVVSDKGETLANAVVSYTINDGPTQTVTSVMDGRFSISAQQGKTLTLTGLKVNGKDVPMDTKSFTDSWNGKIEVTNPPTGGSSIDWKKAAIMGAIGMAVAGGVGAVMWFVRKK